MKVPSPPPPARGLAPTYQDVWVLPKPRPVRAPQRKDPISWPDIAKVLVLVAVVAAIYAAGILTGFVLDVAQ